MTLAGKRALITGGSRGIGAAIARRFANDGADVAITYTSRPDAAEAVVAEIEAAGRAGFAIAADSGDPAAQRSAVEQAAAKLGGLDILVHNAGVFGMATVDAAEQQEFDRQFAINVGGVFAGTAAAASTIADGGRIIIIGSISGDSALFPGMAIYGATKAAVSGLARGWARDLGGRGILVNVIQPGPIETDMNPADSDFAATLRQLVPLGRYGRAEEVAALAAFLASDEASFITGTTIDIDGGASA